MNELTQTTLKKLSMGNVTVDDVYKKEILQRLTRNILVEAEFNLIQPDWIAYKEGKNVIVESKFKKGPLKYKLEGKDSEGFAIEDYQIRSRMAFYNQHQIGTLVLIFDYVNMKTYMQHLHVLERKGQKVSRVFFNRKHTIYNVKDFKEIKLTQYLDKESLQDIKALFNDTYTPQQFEDIETFLNTK